MAYEQRDNSGSVFKNERRRNERDAGYTGSAKIGGKEYWINGWAKKDKNGEPMMSFSFREKQASGGAPKQENVPIDDNIPF